MKAYVNRDNTIVGVLVCDVVEAGHLGYEFAKRYPALTKKGWVLYYYDDSEDLRKGARDASTVEISGNASSIADAIMKLCPECGQLRR